MTRRARGNPRSRRRAAPRPSLPAMERAVRDFLTAVGLDPSLPDLAETPSLVARAWATELLNGYATTPHKVLAERMPFAPAHHAEMVLLKRVRYQSVCPHHLLPYAGLATVAYVPRSEVVGFGQIVRLLDCLARRLVIQEALARQVAEALVNELGARGAAVRLSAEQACFSLRGGCRAGARAVCEAFAGCFEEDAELRARFMAQQQEE